MDNCLSTQKSFLQQFFSDVFLHKVIFELTSQDGRMQQDSSKSHDEIKYGFFGYPVTSVQIDNSI